MKVYGAMFASLLFVGYSKPNAKFFGREKLPASGGRTIEAGTCRKQISESCTSLSVSIYLFIPEIISWHKCKLFSKCVIYKKFVFEVLYDAQHKIPSLRISLLC